jgi:hypothetical protein
MGAEGWWEEGHCHIHYLRDGQRRVAMGSCTYLHACPLFEKGHSLPKMLGARGGLDFGFFSDFGVFAYRE